MSMKKKDGVQRVILARRLLTSGVPLKIDRGDEYAGLRMRQIGGEVENCAFDLRDGRSGFIVTVRITITQSVFAIAGIFLELPWVDHGLCLIEDPLVSGARYDQYWFPGNDTLAFERGLVINHCVNVCRLLRRGATIEGLLLCVGLESIPDAFVHGISFPASVIVFDQFDESYPTEVTLWTDRSQRVARDKQKKTSRPSLFSRRDPCSVGSPTGAGRVLAR
jgi:hypothetical protein